MTKDGWWHNWQCEQDRIKAEEREQGRIRAKVWERMAPERLRLATPYGADPDAFTAAYGAAIRNAFHEHELRQQEDDMTKNTHNDTLTALHVKQGTKFCTVRFWDALGDEKRTAAAREKASEGLDTSAGVQTYKHTMPLDRGDVVALPGAVGSAVGIVVGVDAVPTFGEGIDYKWVVADITDSVDAMHALQDREQKAVEAMAVTAAMSEADKVLEKLGVAGTDKAVALLGGGTRNDDFPDHTPPMQSGPRNATRAKAGDRPFSDDFIDAE